MTAIPASVSEEVFNLIPACLVNDIASFVFYDNHPRDERKIDITICTNRGDVEEFYQRDLISSLSLNCSSKVKDIRIIRNKESKLFYSVSTETELYLVSSGNGLEIRKKLTGIASYDIVDASCSGDTHIKVLRTNDAMPIHLNNNFDSLEDIGIVPNARVDDSVPIVTNLQRKLVEARYIAKCNENALNEHKKLRQKVTLLSSRTLHPNRNDSVFKGLNEASGALRLETKKPWVKTCNKKIIIALNVLSEYDEPIRNAHMILHSASIQSLVYSTKIFRKIHESPFWLEIKPNTLQPCTEYFIVAIMGIGDVKKSITSRIELSGSIAYKTLNEDLLLPFEDVNMSSFESMGDEFDVLSNNHFENNTLLAVLATTEKTDLCLRHVKMRSDSQVSLLDLFCNTLDMETLGDNVLVYRKSPYHALYGIMVVFNGCIEKSVQVSVHARSPSQVLALIHCMNNTLHATVVCTTQNYKITAKTDELSTYNEEIPKSSDRQYNYQEYAKSMLNRSTKVLEHLDKAMIKMSKSKNPSVLSKVGTHIDLYANGVECFKEFKKNILEETRNGVNSLLILKPVENSPESDIMIID